MSSDLAIKVENLSKCYQIYDTPRDRLRQFVLPRAKHAVARLIRQTPSTTNYYKEFWALNNVSFEVHKGETVGIIGRNGSGKSTLLQLICGTLTPTSGSINANGRIAALLELGSGFNPEFTGRENVYMNAAVLGLDKDEIDACFQKIVEFADIGDFIEQPVKIYSSGMTVRLAFAVQAQVNPDILIVDEALSVGDAKFQAKCFERLRQLKEQGASILLVTHSSEQIVTHCSNALLLEQGNMLMNGEPRQVVNRYVDLLFGKERTNAPDTQNDTEGKYPPPAGHLLNLSQDIFSTRHGYNSHEYRWGDGAATITDYYLEAEGDPFPTSIKTGKGVTLKVAIRFNTALFRPILGITIKTKEGVAVYGTNSETLAFAPFGELGNPSTSVVMKVCFNCELASGDYFISIGVATRKGEEIIPHDRRYDAIHIVVPPNRIFFGIANLGLTMQVAQAN
ncbi:MAG: ABC transporter ATP-binding protein [Desulfobulbus sp.]|nr:ABC transporter ATP-binding protein [Desulfobulbus sp.]